MSRLRLTMKDCHLLKPLFWNSFYRVINICCDHPIHHIYTTNLLLQSKPKDGKEREHKSEGEEEGEEADGDEDEFGVRIGFMIKATYFIKIDWWFHQFIGCFMDSLMPGGERWRRLKVRRTLLQLCLPSLPSTRMGSSSIWRPRSKENVTVESTLSTADLNLPGTLCLAQQTRSGCSSC